tara:strand:- start:914 stop:1300 length:387 start_codon:yes stop_codon:yes gene_type:complete
MKKQKFYIDLELDFSLLAISCHLKDYRFVWGVNNILNANFIKTKIYNNGNVCPSYEFVMDSSSAQIYVNRTEENIMINNKPEIDFWLKIYDIEGSQIVKFWCEEIKRIPHVLIVYTEENKKIKEQFLA